MSMGSKELIHRHTEPGISRARLLLPSLVHTYSQVPRHHQFDKRRLAALSCSAVACATKTATPDGAVLIQFHDNL